MQIAINRVGMMKGWQRVLAVLMLLVIVQSAALPVFAEEGQKVRAIILTDMEADPDDKQSLVRLLLYSNQIEIRGLIATTSCWLKTEVNPDSIKSIIHAYAEVYSNLVKHQEGFPKPKSLLNFVKQGLPKYGMLGVGEGQDSEGSDWIIKELEKEDERPLWISVWGGVNTLAQALYKIENSKSKSEAAALIAKLRVYTISDQDDSGLWIRNRYPELFYIVSPGDHYGSATWNAIHTAIDNFDNTTISNDWLAENIQKGHGSLGAMYPDVAWGMEGDTPAYLSLIPNGLNNPEHPEWGGWGGRYEFYQPVYIENKEGSSESGVPYKPETRKIWTNAQDSYTPYVTNKYGRTVKLYDRSFKSDKASLWRWRDDFQNDFAARMDWTSQSYKDANHPPVPILNHAERLNLKSGEHFQLNASLSYDPDGDSLGFLWFQYPEAGSFKEPVKLGPPENTDRLYGVAPEVSKKETVHVILKVTDKGDPQLSRYKRIILSVSPR